MSSNCVETPPNVVLFILFMNVLGKVVKPFILAESDDIDRTIMLRMLYPSTKGSVDWSMCFLFEIVQPFISSYAILSILKGKSSHFKLNSVVVFLILDSYFIICDLIKLDFDREFGLAAVYRTSREMASQLSNSKPPKDQQSIPNHYVLNYTLTAICVHTYLITNVVFKIFSAYVIYFFKSRFNPELVLDVIGTQDTSSLHGLSVSARQAIDCELGTGSVPPAPSAPSIDIVKSKSQQLRRPLIPPPPPPIS